MQAQVIHGRDLLKDYKNSWFHILGRLKPGTTVAQAGANLNVVLRGLLEGPLGEQTQFISKESLHKLQIEVGDGSGGFSQLRGRYQQPLLLLMGIVGLVLLIACVNVANLLLVRALARRREVAVRLALGAGAGRVVRQLLTENLLLAFAGGAAGLMVAHWGTGVLLSMSQASGLEVHLDARVLGATMLLSVFTGLLFGLVPALRAVDVAIGATLKSRSDATGGSAAQPHSRNWGKLLVMGQVALSVLVLFAGGLLVRSMKNLRGVNLGLDQENLLMLRVDQFSAGYKTVAQRTQFCEEIARRLSALPGVRGVAYSQNGLYFGDEAADTIKVDGYVAKTAEDWNAATDRIGPDCFRTLGIPLVSGRELGTQDTASAPKVTVINEALSRFYFGDASPVGRTLWITDEEKPAPFQIVGVVANARDHGLRDQPQRRFYVSIAQSLDAVGLMHFMVRTSRDPDLLALAARGAVRDFNGAIPIVSVASLTNRIDQSIRSEILVAKLSGTFGVLALLLASVGLYGVISYRVTGMTKAIGVRMALGAQRQAVLWMILREALGLVVVGVALGVPTALLCGRLLASTLYGLSGSDPFSMMIVVLSLVVVAFFAGYIPARRAMNVNPIIALREE
jgi:predicted permease